MSNPFIRAFEAPIESATVFAYAMILCAILLATWYALGRNLMTMYITYQKSGWRYNPPGNWVLRGLLVFIALAADALLIGALIHIL